MKRIARRAWAVIFFAALLLAGVAFFTVKYASSAEKWATFSGNPYLYSDGVSKRGTITDRTGELLLSYKDGMTYSRDEALRKATLHLLGDRSGNIAPRLTEEFAAPLADYNSIGGYYASDRETAMRLTIDGTAEKTALAALNGQKGAVIVCNYKTGAILCCVSSPTYDPDGSGVNAEEKQWEGVYLNRPMDGLYVPGSVFKLVTAAAALEKIPDVLQETFTCAGTCDVDGDTITCSGNHGAVTLQEALAKSCNCAFAQLALRLGKETLCEYSEKLEVTESFSVDGIIVPQGHFALSSATNSEAAWAGIGQYTDLINPCAYLRFVSAIANDGVAVKPYFVEEVGRYSHRQGRDSRLLSSETADTLKSLMAYNVEAVYGAGNFSGMTVCAKSGTAEVGGGEKPHAMFTGFVAEEDCPLAFYIAVENGGSGSSVCVPIAGKVLKACQNAISEKTEKN